MPEALTTGAIMQALMNIDVTIKAEVLFAFWASDTKARFVSCFKIIYRKNNQRKRLGHISHGHKYIT
jgi:hypothetical protein